MANYPNLAKQDVEALIGTLAYLAGMDRDLPAKRKVLLEKLATLVKADAWVWGLIATDPASKHLSYSLLLRGGFSDAQYANYLCAQEHPDMVRFNAPLMTEMASHRGHLTRLRQELDPENLFPKSAVYPLWEKANLAPLIISCRPTPDGGLNLIALYRHFAAELFSERDKCLTHLLLSQTQWLYKDDWHSSPNALMHDLSPRLRTICHLLIQGMPRKQIAADTNLSIHTLNDYVKQIYTHFDVHSQSELIRKVVEGDGTGSYAI